LLQRVQRFPGFPVGIEDVDALRDPAVNDARLAEVEALVAIRRGVASLHHGQENIRLREQALDCRRRIVMRQGLNL
jgi:hypothetical protein